MIDAGLKQYIEDSIIPMYDEFDAAHRRDHVDMVIEQSLEIARQHDVNYRASESKDELAQYLPSAADRRLKINLDMVYTVAASR